MKSQPENAIAWLIGKIHAAERNGMLVTKVTLSNADILSVESGIMYTHNDVFSSYNGTAIVAHDRRIGPCMTFRGTPVFASGFVSDGQPRIEGVFVVDRDWEYRLRKRTKASAAQEHNRVLVDPQDEP